MLLLVLSETNDKKRKEEKEKGKGSSLYVTYIWRKAKEDQKKKKIRTENIPYYRGLV